jgi:hypothetical protein
MKSLKWACLTLTLFTFTLNSCKKSSNSTPEVSDSLTLNFNGTFYGTPNLTAVDSSGFLKIYGIFNSAINGTSTIQLLISSNVRVGSYSLGGSNAEIIFFQNTADSYNSQSGTITITSMTSSTIEGTFGFYGVGFSASDASATGTCTGGTFQANYTTKN